MISTVSLCYAKTTSCLNIKNKSLSFVVFQNSLTSLLVDKANVLLNKIVRHLRQNMIKTLCDCLHDFKIIKKMHQYTNMKFKNLPEALTA